LLELDVIKQYRSRKRTVRVQAKATLDASKIVAIYGKSGVGKSTVLRMIAGLEQPDTGSVQFKGTTWFSSDEKVNLPIPQRKIGFVFQDFNLFPTMTVQQNLEYACTTGKWTDAIDALIDALDVRSLLPAHPSELSSGQQQRVAILRSLCQQPDVLLLDEPFSALDDDTIAELIRAIKHIHSVQHTAIVFVSHRKDVIFALAEEVLYLKPGGVVSIGSPEELLKKSLM